MEVKHQQKQREDPKPQLFGTLLASKPARTRSPLALALAVVVHIGVLVLIALISKPFIPSLAQKMFQPITIIVPEEEPLVTLSTPASVPGPRMPKVEKKITTSTSQPLVFTPGPITPIAPATDATETVEPDDNGVNGGAPATLADKLRLNKIDPRLSPSATFGVPPDMSPAAALRARIAQSLEVFNDSVAAEEAAAERATDWTVKTKDGGRWGISPGKIHLGNITLPLPVAFNTPPGRRDEVNARNRGYAEVEAQVKSEIGRQSFKDRVKAIRARKDKEREEEKKKGSDAPITN